MWIIVIWGIVSFLFNFVANVSNESTFISLSVIIAAQYLVWELKKKDR